MMRAVCSNKLASGWWIVCLPLWAAACIGGQSGTPTSGRPIDAGCDDGPEASTALGVRGQDLWDAFCGEYTIEVRHSHFSGGQTIREPNTQLTVRVEPLNTVLEATKVCDDVVVAVWIAIDSHDDSLDATFIGALHGPTPQGFVNFGSLVTPGDGRQISGTMRFDPELQEFQVSEHRRKLDISWSYERGSVP